MSGPVPTVGAMRNAYVCYEIRIPANVGPFYIGVCAVADLNRFHDAQSNSEWRRYMDNNAPIETITVLAFSADIQPLKAMQTVLGANAWCNIHHDDKAMPNEGKRVRCIETGVIYNSAAEVARELGVTRQAISQHIAKREPRILQKRYTFERIV